MKKLIIIDSHPVQYRTPLFNKLSKEMELKVFFRRSGATTEEYDPEFGRKIKWDIPLLEGYSWDLYSSLWDLLRSVAKSKADGIMIFGWNSIDNWVVCVFAKFLGKKVLLQSESPLRQEYSKKGSKNIVRKFLLKIFFKLINFFLYIGEENKKFYEFYGVSKENMFFTPYSVDNDRLRGSKIKMREELGLDKNDVVILFVGKLISKKRPMDLLLAYHNLDLPNKKLVFVGEGEQKKNLEKYADDNNLEVMFAGFKNQTELPSWYSAADVFVLPSGIGETWGLVVNEAMNFSLPIIVSDMVGCGPDLVKEGENGFIFKTSSIEDLVSKLNMCMDGELRRKFGRKSRDIVDEYNYDRNLDSIKKAIYTNV